MRYEIILLVNDTENHYGYLTLEAAVREGVRLKRCTPDSEVSISDLDDHFTLVITEI